VCPSPDERKDPFITLIIPCRFTASREHVLVTDPGREYEAKPSRMDRGGLRQPGKRGQGGGDHPGRRGPGRGRGAERGAGAGRGLLPALIRRNPVRLSPEASGVGLLRRGGSKEAPKTGARLPRRAGFTTARFLSDPAAALKAPTFAAAFPPVEPARCRSQTPRPEALVGQTIETSLSE